MNTSLYKKIRELAMQLVTSARANNVIEFEKQYEELKRICADNENTEKNHPTQWETLADFTEDAALAVDIYLKALSYAEKLPGKTEVKENSASICFALADRYAELGETKIAIDYATKAKVLAEDINDPELKKEINQLIKDQSDKS